MVMSRMVWHAPGHAPARWHVCRSLSALKSHIAWILLTPREVDSKSACMASSYGIYVTERLSGPDPDGGPVQCSSI
jgi:hypothetical protein